MDKDQRTAQQNLISNDFLWFSLLSVPLIVIHFELGQGFCISQYEQNEKHFFHVNLNHILL